MPIFAERRARFMQAMGQGVAILPAAHEVTRSNDTEFPFRQDSDFHYLTGFPEPDAIAVLRPGHPKPYVLFVRPRDREREIWTGLRVGVEGAVERYGADEAFPMAEFSAKLPTLLENTPTLFARLGRDRRFDEQILSALEEVRKKGRQGIEAPASIVDPSRLLAEMRLFKSEEEVALLQRACDITATGHLAAMRAAQPGMFEYEIQAIVEYEFRKAGASAPGYGTIVAAGSNATILHYVENRQRLEDGALLLIDAGAEYEGYTGDVTRTFPVGRRFSGPQRDVYEIVLAAQRSALDACRPGTTLESIHETACRVITQGLVDLKVLEGSVDGLIEQKSFRPYYMHRTGHWLGLDVHDVGAYVKDGKPRTLAPGMVFTVEPGLYFHADTPAPIAFYGIGVRIEDDVLITPEGHRNLTAAIPKEVAEIEVLRA